MGKRVWCFLFFYMTLLLFLHARDYMFKHIGPKDGLSNSQVNVIYKDSRGYMWFGTASGLNRYDGYHFNVYRNSLSDATTLPDSYITDIQEASDGNLWVNTFKGYALYNPNKDMFDRDIRKYVFEFGLDVEPTLVYIDKKKNYWFYIEGKGCYWYNAAQKILYPFLQSEKASALPMGKISHITECKEGTLLVYENGLLVCVNGDMRRIAWMNDFIPSSSEKLNSFHAFVDKKDNVWVYGDIGLMIYNKEQNKWVTSLEVLAKQWEVPVIPAMSDAVVGVAQNENGTLWIATRNNGLLVADPQTKTFSWLKTDPDDNRSIRHNSLKSIYVSPEKNIIWVGTAKSGIAYYSESAFKFKVDTDYDVTAIISNPQGGYWLGTNGNGILSYNPLTEESKPLPGFTNKENDVISALLLAGDGKLWFGTDKGTLYSMSGGKSTAYQIVSGGIESVPVAFPITSVVEDEKGDIWIGTLGAGVQCLDAKNGKITVYNRDKNKLASDNVTSLFLSKNHNLIIGTSEGISIMDIAKNNVTSYIGCKNGNKPFSNIYVNQVIEDRRGLLWIATRDGLNIYDVKNDHLDIINVAEGLSNAVICGVVENEAQTVWITTAGGISNIVVEEGKNKGDYSFRIYNYTEMDGLQGAEFNPRSILAVQGGVLAVGGLHGLNIFNPNAIIYNKTLPKVIFSGLRLFDEDVSVGKKYGGRVLLKNAIDEERRLELDKSQSMFTIQFGSDDYTMPEKTRFKYKLEGFHDEWLLCEPLQNSATFTNLDPGRYILKVKAVNSDGYNSDETAQLIIVVKGPFWTTIWAHIILLVVAIGLLWLLAIIWMKRERKLIREQLCGGAVRDSQLQTEEDAFVEDDITSDNDSSMFPGEKEGPESAVLLNKSGSALANASDRDMERMNSNPEEFPLVMAVDGNTEFLAFINDGLHFEFRVKMAHDIDEAWERILLLNPDIILCSVSAPDAEGYELCRRIKAEERTSDIPVILLTSRLTEDIEDIGVEDYLTKPFTIDTLIKRINALLPENKPTENKVEEILDTMKLKATVTSNDELLVNNAIRYIEENISRADLSVEEMAREMGMSRAHLYKKLIAVSGKTPIGFIRSIRLKRAAELLKDRRFNVSEVAYQVGFNNPKYFAKYFSEEYGVLPSVYQERKK